MAGTYSPANLDKAVVKIRAIVARESQTWATMTQLVMRNTAPWVDRGGDSATGLNARQSLETEMGIIGDDVIIVARSTRATTRPWRGFAGAPVGAFLELGTRFMAARPVIKPRVIGQSPLLFGAIQAALK